MPWRGVSTIVVSLSVSTLLTGVRKMKSVSGIYAVRGEREYSLH